MKKYLLILSAVLLFCAKMSAETVTLAPTDDMYSDHNHAGTAPLPSQLWTAHYSATGHFERIMLKFDLTPYAGKTIQSAKLKITRLYSCPSSGTTSAKFIKIAEAWQESSWNHAQHIQLDEQIAMPYVFSGPGGNAVKTFDIEIKDFLGNWIGAGTTDYGFVIKANSNQKFSKFYSKEHPNQQQRPSLELTYEETKIESELAAESKDLISTYPNPFNPSTTINFSLNKPGYAELKIYNAAGCEIAILASGQFSAGAHSVSWNANDKNWHSIPSGVYYSVLKTVNGITTGRMLLLK